MNDKLKLSDPHGDAELDRIVSALEADENRKLYEKLRKNVRDLERMVAERELAARKAHAPAKANNKIGARKDGVFKAVSSAPSFNRTPVGPAMVPLPYPTTIDLSNSTGVASSVRFNGKQVYTLASLQARCKGDEKGSGGGVKSGTVNGEVKPTGASTTVRVEGKRVVRDGDPCTMNGGNNPGIYVTAPPTSGAAPRDALATSNPPVKLETPAEETRFKRWLHHTSDTIKAAIASPGEGLIGAAKGLGNIPSNIAELLLTASVEQGASEMEQAAMSQALFGHAEDAEKMMHVAAETREQGLPFEVPKFKMSNPAQEGGDTIATVVQLFAGAVGIVKSAARSAAALGKVGSTTRAVEIGAQVVDPAITTGNGIVDVEAFTAARPNEAGSGLLVVRKSEGATISGRVLTARVRQEAMLRENVGYNISPTAWDEYSTIGRNGSFISDKEGVMGYFEDFGNKSEITISIRDADLIERDMGLVPGSLSDGFKVRKILDIKELSPSSPLEGNKYFLGAGNHLPGGSPEMVINSISTKDNAYVKTIFSVKVEK